MQNIFSLAALCPILIWIALVGFFLAVCYAVQDGVIRLRRLHQVPCSRCAYFTGSYYLKCPVHPCRALSEEAIDCRDYEPVAVAQPVCQFRQGCRQGWLKQWLSQ